MPKLAIVFNSRQRLNDIENLLISIIDNIDEQELSMFHIYIGCDDDDEEMLNASQQLECIYPFLTITFQPRSIKLNQRSNNVVKNLDCKYILLLNDDVLITNKNFIKTIIDTLDKYLEDKPDGIVLGRTQDNSCDKQGPYASFPVVSKVAADKLGYVVPDCFNMFAGDVLLHRIFDSVNRVCDIPVMFDHTMHRTMEDVHSPDQTAIEVRSVAGNISLAFIMDVSGETNKLYEIMDVK